MTTWDISETRSLIQRIFGKKQAELARPCIRSVIDRQNFARYHLYEAKSLLRRFQRRHLFGDAPLIDVTLGTNSKGQMAFQRFIIKAAAHVTACVQSVHAIPDILANAMYYSAGMNLGSNAISETKIALNSVAFRLWADRRFHPVGAVLKEIPLAPNHAHLSAVANLSKHSNIVKTSLSEDWTGKRANYHELRLSSFERGGKHFPEIEVFSLVAPVYDSLSSHIVDAGCQLNVALQEIAP